MIRKRMKNPFKRCSIKIDKGIPIPKKKIFIDKMDKYPWEIMEIGDSFKAERICMNNLYKRNLNYYPKHLRVV